MKSNRYSFPFRVLATVALILAGLFAGALRADTYTDPRSGIEFPEKVGSLERTEVKPYDLPSGESGVAVSYRSDKVIVTAYIRSLKESGKSAADYVKQTMAEVKNLEGSGVYADVQFFEVVLEKGFPGWISGGFTGKKQDMEVLSYVYCKVANGGLLKLRITSPDLSPKNVRAISEKFLKLLDQ